MRRRPTRRRTSVAAVAVATFAILGAVTGLGPAGRAEPAAGQTSGLLALLAQTPAVGPEQPFALQVRVTGAPPLAHLEIDVHNRVLTRTQFLASIDGERLRTRLKNLSVSLEETPPDPSGSVAVNVATRSGSGDAAAVRLSQPGVYPVVVSLDGRRGHGPGLVHHPHRESSRGRTRRSRTRSRGHSPQGRGDGSRPCSARPAARWIGGPRRSGPGRHRDRRLGPPALPRPSADRRPDPGDGGLARQRPGVARRHPARSRPARERRTSADRRALRRSATGRLAPGRRSHHAQP